jgi:hypothetical protein
MCEFRHHGGLSPDLYKSLRVWHKKMRAMYAHCRKRKLQALRAALGTGAVGRNDPCPQARKYKKCCMGKSAIPTSDLHGHIRDAGPRSP